MGWNSSADFGYPWWLSYGHLVLFGPSLLVLAWGRRRHWPKWLLAPLFLLAIWSGAAFLVARFVIDVNRPPSLPTERFFPSGAGTVLDLGAGTGRSAIMVLKARPGANLVALDLFAKSFDQHFGTGGTPQDRLLANLRIAGVEKRVRIETADMRRLPFEPGSFDAVVSAYAVDHLNREGIGRSLAETARVLKPGGDFLLMVIGREPWASFAFGPLLSHGGARGAAWWSSRLRETGFEVVEDGTRPLTLYLLARRL